MTRTAAAPRQVSAKRRQASEARRQALLDAALDVFVDEGFAAARVDHIAARAGVAKGTVYLFFEDKQDLFEKVVLNAIGPVLDRLKAVADQQQISFEMVLGALLHVFQNEILGTKRQHLLRLVITEAPRFPKIAEFYHREVISRGLPLIDRITRRGYERGELSSDALVRFPHLLFAPMLLAIMWEAAFARFQPLDAPGMLAAFRDLALSPARKQGQST